MGERRDRQLRTSALRCASLCLTVPQCAALRLTVPLICVPLMTTLTILTSSRFLSGNFRVSVRGGGRPNTFPPTVFRVANERQPRGNREATERQGFRSTERHCIPTIPSRDLSTLHPLAGCTRSLFFPHAKRKGEIGLFIMQGKQFE